MEGQFVWNNLSLKKRGFLLWANSVAKSFNISKGWRMPEKDFHSGKSIAESRIFLFRQIRSYSSFFNHFSPFCNRSTDVNCILMTGVKKKLLEGKTGYVQRICWIVFALLHILFTFAVYLIVFRLGRIMKLLGIKY